MRVNIDVNQQCIDNGCRNNPTGCPTAHGIHPHIREDVGVWVGKDDVYFSAATPKDSCRVDLPEHVGLRIYSYDQGEMMTPFKFDFEIPNHLLKESTKCSLTST